jgi:hypothetical protein
MKSDTRIRLEMGTRVRGFNRDHPSDNPGHAAAVARLEEQLARAEVLAQQERAGHLSVRATVLYKTERRRILRDGLRLLAGVADAAASEAAGATAPLTMPHDTTNHRAFLTAAKVALTQATSQRELFLKYGMAPDFLGEFSTTLNQYEEAINQKSAAQTAHVGARADLDQVAGEIMHTVEQLDVLNRHRFRNDHELLAAWKSARNVAWPTRKPGGEEQASAEKAA